jgi:hypothetical protein
MDMDLLANLQRAVIVHFHKGGEHHTTPRPILYIARLASRHALLYSPRTEDVHKVVATNSHPVVAVQSSPVHFPNESVLTANVNRLPPSPFVPHCYRTILGTYRVLDVEGTTHRHWE